MKNNHLIILAIKPLCNSIIMSSTMHLNFFSNIVDNLWNTPIHKFVNLHFIYLLIPGVEHIYVTAQFKLK